MRQRSYIPGKMKRTVALEEASAVEKGKAALKEAKSRKEWFDRTHPGRMLKRISEGNGNIIAGGIAYLSLTSLAAALVIGVTISTYLVHFNANWNEAFYGFIDDTIPGVIKADGPDSAGLVDPDSLEPQTLTGIVGIVTFLILINTASRYLSATRIGSIAMLDTQAGSPVKGKLRDFGALLALLILVLLGALLQVAASQFSTVIAGWVSDQPLSDWLIRGPAFAVGVLVDMAFVALAIVVLGSYRGPRVPLIWTLLAAAISIGILRQAVSLVIGGVKDNAVLASAASVIAIMIFVNFVARIVLYAAAWLGTLAPSEAGPGEFSSTEMESIPRRGHGSVTTARAMQRDRE
ncbi:YihY/virulence factor BrkB family protein [Demequina aurantiaca]|uniref:YihY/virulence factor BrkB family protein n=1 Tax=Demequina aurantiaca TaxID=676200 RepID=UPI000A7F5A49|nr:YihY/virulence factor BrkB family protein [Demequina aurantiaca]